MAPRWNQSCRNSLNNDAQAVHPIIRSNQWNIRTFIRLKRLTAILFLSVYLLSTTECSELLKLPVLLTHFEEHRAVNSQLTLVQFLHMHYTGDDQNDADQQRDMQLPFKTHDNCSAQLIQVCPPLFCSVALPRILHAERPQPGFPHDVFVSSAYLSNIWQPPKNC